MSIDTGLLYVVATPIGNLKDISQRALEVLGSVELIAAEDTRHSRKLLDHYGIGCAITSLHEHNEAGRAGELLARLRRGDSIALISDAGTPLISDPGYRLVHTAREDGIRVVPVPGASALSAALSVAGLPTDRFAFEGFPPARADKRKTQLARLALEERTLVFYESSHRILRSLRDMAQCLGYQRQAVLARELTKVYETVLDGTLASLSAWLEQSEVDRRGEFVVIVAGNTRTASSEDVSQDRVVHVLKVLLEEVPLKAAVRMAAGITGEARNRVYRIALTLNADT